MDFIDDEAEASSSDHVLVPSSQTDDNPRSRKRRRLEGRRPSSSDEEDYDLPPNPSAEEVDGEDEDGERSNHKSKYEDRIHVPLCADRPADTFVTQLTQQWSSPSRIRGPRWVKPRQGVIATPSKPKVQDKTPTQPVTTSFLEEDFDDGEDDDDIALLEAIEAAENAPQSTEQAETVLEPSQSVGGRLPRAPMQRASSFRQTTLHGIHTTQQEPSRTQSQSTVRVHNWPLANKNEPPTHHQINRSAMRTWVYPTNLGKIRDYQYNIVHKGLFHNLLVALPTGLGKTFIAATIMLNWFRWTENAQMVFVAPTKPLVSQQVDACFHIAGIPRSQTTMLTGEVPPAIRAEEWQEKRVFFMTPQTLINDLKNGMCDPKKIVLIVVDEAHKATGNYAYVEVVKFLRRFNQSFRVLALTATPGATVEAVQEVINGLGIARVEIRTEDSLDIREFVHSRDIETEIFENSDEIAMSLELFCAAVRPLMGELNSQNAYWGKDPSMITLYGLKKASDQWRLSEAGRRAPAGLKWKMQGIFAVLMSLAHNLELLKYHGIGPFYHKMKAFADEAAGGKGKYAKQVANNENFQKLMNRLRIWVNDPEFVGHPKLAYLKTVVLNHFMDAGEGQQGSGNGTQRPSTRIMVFAHYRDSAEEIVRVLNRHGPMIRARVFVGQSGTKGSEGMDQKTQMDVIKKFKAGTYNTIVATSIGEEGLDIGEVDLIVCYDCSKSPIRMLQRMGRTGRKRAGKIVLLLMKGKEESDYYQAKDNYQKMQAKIESGREFDFREEESPRIVPKDINPVVDKRVVEIPIENTQNAPLEPTRRRAKKLKKPAKKFHMPDGVETGFSFLGKNGSKKKKEETPKKKTDLEVASLPPLEEVSLTAEEEDALDQRYVRLAGIEDEFIQFVRFGAFPEQQRRLGRTNSVQHSRATKSLVRALKAMRDPYAAWERPREYVEVGEPQNCSPDETSKNKRIAQTSEKRRNNACCLPSSRTDTPARTRTGQNVSSSTTKKSRPGPRRHGSTTEIDLLIRSSSRVGGSSPNQYDGNDSFIDDSDNVDNGDDDDDPSPSLQSLPDPFLASPNPRRDRILLSQQSIDYDGMSQEFPDLEAILGAGLDGYHIGTKSKDTVLSASPDMLPRPPHRVSSTRNRRIVDSDDDDE
ncbi:ATP-dependent DNA helicase mph1 [Exophiala dermatitidis]